MIGKEIVKIQRYNSEGEGVGVLNSGKSVFVPFTAAGETVEIDIVHEKKNLALGKLARVIKASPDRTPPVCPAYTRCGGCSLMHIDYQKQLEIKTGIVAGALKKIGGLDFEPLPCVPSPDTFGCRNKAGLPVSIGGGETVIGFYEKGSHNVANIDSCPIHGGWLDEIIAVFRQYITEYGVTVYDENTKKGLIRHIVARRLSGGLQICAVINGAALPHQEALIEALSKRFDDFSLLISINTVHNNVIMGDRTLALFGDEKLQGSTCGISYSVGIDSFLQVNAKVSEAMYFKAVEIARAGKADTVIDAYSGIGIMTAMFAKPARYVYGMEIVPQATHDADMLMKANGITNVKNITADCGKALPALIGRVRKETADSAAKAGGQEDGKLIVVLDPPRKGCDPAVISALNKCRADRIIYISCDPATLARDLKQLTVPGAYTLEYVQPFDMFPQTANVETLVCLERSGAEK